MTRRDVYIGTYTRPAPHLERADGEGIYVASYDASNGTLTPKQVVRDIENPTFLTLSEDGKTLHAIWEIGAWSEGLVSTYRRDPNSGMLTYANVQSVGGSLPCFVTVSPGGSYALIANYLSGSVTMLPRRADGTLGEVRQVLQQQGTGPNELRQQGPHAHCVVLDPEEVFAFSADLGADTIFGYRLPEEQDYFRPHSSVRLPPGSGPRHMAFHPTGRFAYVTQELSSTLTAFHYSSDSGQLELLQTFPMLPSGYLGTNHSSELQIHPSGKFLYGSNRGHDSICIYSIDQDSGMLNLLGWQSTEGRTPRNFVIDPAGKFLLVANQDSGTVVTLPINSATGELGESVATASFPSPACLKFGP